MTGSPRLQTVECSLDWLGITPSIPSLRIWIRESLEEQGIVLRWAITHASPIPSGGADARRLQVEAVLLLS